MKKFKIKCFCKINLSLRVVKRLDNNYHIIKSLITFCDLHDIITISKIRGLSDNIIFSGRFKKGINKKLNSITKVLLLLRKENFLKDQAFKINVKKNIPHGSGLGGGSSDVAGLLNFFTSKKFFKINEDKKNKIARKIGFDVPIILKKVNTFLTGKKGEILRIKKKFELNILIVYPNFICSTKKIYEKNKKFTLRKNLSNPNVSTRKNLIDFLINEGNDLEKTATKLYPQIKKVIHFISAQYGCYFSRITGSGSACIGIFSNMKTAISAQKMIKLKFPKYWCVISKTI